jgi:hypothetical protein
MGISWWIRVCVYGLISQKWALNTSISRSLILLFCSSLASLARCLLTNQLSFLSQPYITVALIFSRLSVFTRVPCAGVPDWNFVTIRIDTTAHSPMKRWLTRCAFPDSRSYSNSNSHSYSRFITITISPALVSSHASLLISSHRYSFSVSGHLQFTE